MRHIVIVSVACLALACGSDTTENPSGSSSGSGASTSSSGGSAQGGSAQGGSAQGGAAQGGSAQGGAGGAAQGGNGQGGAGMACTWSPTTNPCGAGAYCNAPACGTGTCAPLSTANDGVKSPVCGCDGIDYWNATTAANYGMAVQASGQCAQAKFCGGLANLPCVPAQNLQPPVPHACAMLGNTATYCNIADNGGACWGMPATCDAIVIGGDLRNCFTNQCTTECEAIKSGTSHYQDTANCPQ